MPIQTESLKEVLGELFALLEAQETNAIAVLQFLKDQGITTDEKLAPFLEQAGNASSVKWRAARMRMEYLLTPVQKQNEDDKKAREEAQQAAHTSESEKGSEAKKADAKEGPDNKPGQAQSPGDGHAENPPNQNRSAHDGSPNDERHSAKRHTA